MTSEKVALDIFSPEVRLVAKGSPQSLIENYVRLSAIEFCSRTQVIQRTHEIMVQDGISEYPIPQTDQELPVSVMRYEFLDKCACPPRVDIEFILPDRVYITMPCDNNTCDHTPFRMLVATTPTPDACEVDRTLYLYHSEAIINGAIYRLLSIPGVGWSSLRDSEIYRDRTERAIISAGVDRVVGPKRLPQRIQGRRMI